MIEFWVSMLKEKKNIVFSSSTVTFKNYIKKQIHDAYLYTDLGICTSIFSRSQKFVCSNNVYLSKMIKS